MSGDLFDDLMTKIFLLEIITQQSQTLNILL